MVFTNYAKYWINFYEVQVEKGIFIKRERAIRDVCLVLG